MYSFVAVLILGLGIGVSTAAFSLTNAAIFRRLPLPESDQLVALFRTAPESNALLHSPATFNEFRETASSYSSLSAWYTDKVMLVAAGEPPERVARLSASANILSTLRLKPHLGRDFAPDEEQPGHGNVVMLTYRYWLQRFSGNPAVIGRTLRVGTEGVTVIGVLPPVFDTLPKWQQINVVRPFILWPTFFSLRRSKWLEITGRLKPNVTLQSANAESAALAARLANEYPADNAGQTIRTVPFSSSSVNDGARKVYWLITTLALSVLVIASANLASVQLARAFGRSQELAIRYALGGRPFALMKPVCGETLVLCTVGGVFGLFIAHGANLTIAHFQPQVAPTLLDLRVLSFTSMVTVLAGIVSGVVPAWIAMRRPVNDALKEMSRGSTSGRAQKSFGNWLVGSQLALAVILVSAALTLAVALRSTLSREVGWSGRDLVEGYISLSPPQYLEKPAQVRFLDALRIQLSQIPGVNRVSISTWIPIHDYFDHEKLFVDGAPPSPPGQEPLVLMNAVDAEYFSMLGIRFREGQMFPKSINRDAPPVAIVNEALARRYWPNESAIGKRLRVSENGPWNEVVGVVNDVRMAGNLGAPASRMQLYVPLEQNTRFHCSFTVQSRLPFGALEKQIRSAVARIDVDVTITRLSPIDETLRVAVGAYDFLVITISSFALIGLLIAMIGLYGVMAQFAIRSRREIGVRLALGATENQILTFTLSRAARVICAGLMAGSIGMFFVRSYYLRLMPELPLPGVAWQLGIVGALGAVALFAVLVPALRASKTDPSIVLRSE